MPRIVNEPSSARCAWATTKFVKWVSLLNGWSASNAPWMLTRKKKKKAVIVKRRGKFVKNLSQLPFIVPRMLIVKAKTPRRSIQDDTIAMLFSHAGVGDWRMWWSPTPVEKNAKPQKL